MSEAVASTTASLTKLRASLDLLHGVVARIDTAQQQMRAQLGNQALAVQESARLHDATARALAKLTERLDAVGRVCPASGQHRLAYDAQEVHGGRRQPHMNRAGTQIPYAVVESTHGVAAAAFPAPLLPTDRIVAAGVPEIVLHLGAPKVFEEIPTKTSAAAVVTKAASAPTALLLTDQVVVVDALQGEYNQVAFTPTRCLTQGLAVCADVQLAAVTREATLCPSPTAAVLNGELKHYVEPFPKEDYGTVITHIGGMSLFLEFDIGPGEEIVYKDMMSDEDIGDSVLTNVGGLSVFLEQPMNSLEEPKGVTDTSIVLDHAAPRVQLVYLLLPPQEVNKSDFLTLPWDPSTQGDVTHDPIFLLTYATNSVKLSLPWDPGKQDVTYNCPKEYTRLVSLWAPMKWRKTVLADSLGKAGGGSVPCLQITLKCKLFAQWDPRKHVRCWLMLSQYFQNYLQSNLGPEVCANSDHLLGVTNLCKESGQHGFRPHGSMVNVEIATKKFGVYNISCTKDATTKHWDTSILRLICHTTLRHLMPGFSYIAYGVSVEDGLTRYCPVLKYFPTNPLVVLCHGPSEALGLLVLSPSELITVILVSDIEMERYIAIEENMPIILFDVHTMVSVVWLSQVQQEPCKPQFKQWDPGIFGMLVSKLKNGCILETKQVCRWTSRRRYLCRNWRYSMLRPVRAIAWGQAMFFGGGNVTPVHIDISCLMDLGRGPTRLGVGIGPYATCVGPTWWTRKIRRQQQHGRMASNRMN